MEIALLSSTALKIKSKKATIIVDASKDMPKTPADGIIFLSSGKDISKVSDYRIVITGQGEYEVGGIKVTGLKNNVYSLNIDNVDVLLARTSDLEDLENISDHKVAIFNVDGDSLNQSLLTSTEANVIVLYGEKSKEASKSLGKEHQSLNKVVVNEDRLPEEMQLILLG